MRELTEGRYGIKDHCHMLALLDKYIYIKRISLYFSVHKSDLTDKRDIVTESRKLYCDMHCMLLWKDTEKIKNVLAMFKKPAVIKK